MSRAPVLLWTRDLGARETVPLVLGRMGQPWVSCDDASALIRAVARHEGTTLVMLGPSFTIDEACRICETLCAVRDVAVVLLEDAMLPEPPSVSDDVVVRLRLPVRPRTLVRLIDNWREAA